MGLRVDYTYKGITRNNAYVNISVFNIQKMNGQWNMELAARIWIDKDDILICSELYRKIVHTPGECIHEEGYAYIKSLPEFAGATDDI